MGQAGSAQPALSRYQHVTTLPHEPHRRAPKVLPSLEASPRLRCTDNGVILHSGGTISGRRALSATLPANTHAPYSSRATSQHVGVYRSRSASSGETPPAPSAEPPRRLARERDPLHRSHNHLDLHNPLDSTVSKRFGSEPDLRNEDEPPKQRTNKYFRKKYKAPQPPSHNNDDRDGSSPDSYEGNTRNAPPRKLRLFKTRSETKQFINQNIEVSGSQWNNTRHKKSATEFNEKVENQSLDRLNKTPMREKEQFVKYPDSDMVQSPSSLRTEEHLLHGSRLINNYKKCKNDKSNAYRAKANKVQECTDGKKTPHLDRNFRYSERFKKESPDPPVLRREKSFDATLVAKSHNLNATLESEHSHKIKLIGEQLKNRRLSPLTTKEQPLRKSLPSLLVTNNDEKDEFQAELKKATNRIRTENNLNINSMEKLIQNKPSQNDRNNKCNRNKAHVKKQAPLHNIKVKESSPKKSSISLIRQESNIVKNSCSSIKTNNHTQIKKKIVTSNTVTNKVNGDLKNDVITCNRESRGLQDRGQASGKESTPEQSPSRINEIEKNKEKEKTAPSKQFYFGMIESKEVDVNENFKDFPGLGSPIIEEFSNFHLIEKKLLGYHDNEMEVDKFATRLQSTDHNPKNVSSESALSSSEEEAGSAGSGKSSGIALHLRPTLPKKQLEIPRFSPAAAWRQLAQIETEPELQHVLAVEIKSPLAGDPSAESPNRSDKSGDKSEDSGISGDHAHSDERLDSPPRPHVSCGGAEASAWTPQQDLEGDSGSDGLGAVVVGQTDLDVRGDGLVTYSARGQPFSLSLPRDRQGQSHDKNKQFQQPFNSLQKLKKSVSGAFGAALGSRKFDLEHEPILDDPGEQNWFLSKSAPNSLNPFVYAHPRKGNHEGDIKEEPTPPASDQEDAGVATWSSAAGGDSARNASYLSWGGHVMYLPPPPTTGAHVKPGPPVVQHTAQPLSLLLTSAHPERPMRSKSSGEIELRSRARAARDADEMRERERSASPALAHAAAPSSLARAIPARVTSATPSPPTRGVNGGGNSSNSSGGGRTRGKRFTFQSTVRQLERRRIAEKLSREADLKEQQRRTELEAMRRVEEEFQRKRAREKASIRQQLRLVSGATSLPPLNHKQARDDPDGAVSTRGSPAPEHGNVIRKERERKDEDNKHSNASSEISARSKSTTPVRCVELSEWREGPGANTAARQYRDWGAPAGTQHAHSIAHPPACYRMPKSPAPVYLNANSKEGVDTFSGSPRSDNYRLEFARGVPRSPRTPRAPRHPLASRATLAPHSPSSSSSELSTSVGGVSHHRQAIRLREGSRGGLSEPAIVPTLQPAPAAPRLHRAPHPPTPAAIR